MEEWTREEERARAVAGAHRCAALSILSMPHGLTFNFANFFSPVPESLAVRRTVDPPTVRAAAPTLPKSTLTFSFLPASANAILGDEGARRPRKNETQKNNYSSCARARKKENSRRRPGNEHSVMKKRKKEIKSSTDDINLDSFSWRIFLRSWSTSVGFDTIDTFSLR